MWTVVRAAGLVPVPWRNGQGTTRDIITHAGPSGALLWQASIADLDRDADFSDFTGFDRIFTPISGGTVELSFGDAGYLPCPVLHPVAFRGEQRTRCRVPHGPARAFNAIWDRSAHAGTVEVLSVAPGASLGSIGAACVLHCWQGILDLCGDHLNPGDSCHGMGRLDAVAMSAAVVLRMEIT